MRAPWHILAVVLMSQAATVAHPRLQLADTTAGVHAGCGEPSPLPEFRFDDKDSVWRLAGRRAKREERSEKISGHVLRVEHSPTSRYQIYACLLVRITMSCRVLRPLATSVFPLAPYSPRFVVDGRARCRRCGTAVGKGEIRIGFPMHDSRGEDGAVTGVFLASVVTCFCVFYLRLSLRSDVCAAALAPLPLSHAQAGIT